MREPVTCLQRASCLRASSLSHSSPSWRVPWTSASCQRPAANGAGPWNWHPRPPAHVTPTTRQRTTSGSLKTTTIAGGRASSASSRARTGARRSPMLCSSQLRTSMTRSRGARLRRKRPSGSQTLRPGAGTTRTVPSAGLVPAHRAGPGERPHRGPARPGRHLLVSADYWPGMLTLELREILPVVAPGLPPATIWHQAHGHLHQIRAGLAEPNPPGLGGPVHAGWWAGPAEAPPSAPVSTVQRKTADGQPAVNRLDVSSVGATLTDLVPFTSTIPCGPCARERRLCWHGCSRTGARSPPEPMLKSRRSSPAPATIPL